MASKMTWKDLIDVDFPDVEPITEETIAEIIRLSFKHRGSMRVSTGRIWAADEYTRWRNSVMNTPLP